MTRRDEIDSEIRNQAVRHYSECRALFELPLIVYNQIMQDNDLRKRPYKGVKELPDVRRPGENKGQVSGGIARI